MNSTVVQRSSYLQFIEESLVPTNLNDKSYDELVIVLCDYFNPKPSTIVQCFKFNTRVRESGESVSSYVAALNHWQNFAITV